MTESRDRVDPPFSKRSVQLTIAAFALVVSLWQMLGLTRLALRAQNAGEGVEASRRWGELSGSGHPLIQIDVNQAGPHELSLLPGVGPVLARRIVENRQRFGPFESLEALSRVHGIGAKTIDQIRVIAFVEADPNGRHVTGLTTGGQVEKGNGGAFDQRGRSATMQ